MNCWETKSDYKITKILGGRSNVFLVTNGERNILIDTGPKFMRKLLEQRLKNLNINHIDYLILTHTHFDHSENAHLIKEKYQALLIVHKNEASVLAAGENTIPKGTNFFTRLIVKLFAKRFLSGHRYEPCQYDYLVNDYFSLKDFGFNGYIMHTPGHSPGSMSIIIDDEIALVGDTMFGISKNSVLPPYAENIEQIVTSWGKLLDTKCSVFIPSHGSANSREQVEREFVKMR